MNFPDEILVNIFEYIDLFDVANLRLCSRRFKDILLEIEFEFEGINLKPLFKFTEKDERVYSMKSLIISDYPSFEEMCQDITEKDDMYNEELSKYLFYFCVDEVIGDFDLYKSISNMILNGIEKESFDRLNTFLDNIDESQEFVKSYRKYMIFIRDHSFWTLSKDDSTKYSLSKYFVSDIFRMTNDTFFKNKMCWILEKLNFNKRYDFKFSEIHNNFKVKLGRYIASMILDEFDNELIERFNEAIFDNIYFGPESKNDTLKLWNRIIEYVQAQRLSLS